ncbi:MAG: hypothetical protein PHO32_07625, partial [Candidatus Cloacimonetes bacterium]|nr:hypothetical protein [Candidatus Cloacimonadota bacterium]
VSQDVVYENTDWTKNVDTHNLQFPNFFAIFGIAEGQNGYQTHVLSLIDNQLEYDWLMMRAYRQLWFWGLFVEPETDSNLLWLYAYRVTRRLHTEELVLRYPSVEYDIAAKMITYDKDVVNGNLN